MASVGVSAIKLIDSDGDALDDGAGKLNVNATLVNSDDINIGNVVLQTDAGTDIYAVTAETDASPNLDARLLLGTHALLSARKDASTTVGLTCEDSTHNALHVAISDGGEIAAVTSNRLLIDGSGVTQPISGTVTANLSSTDNTVLDNIQTAVELLDDAIYADDANWSDGSSKHMLVGGLYESSEQSVTDGDVAPLSINDKGMLKIDIKEVGGVNSHWFTASTGSATSAAHPATTSYSTGDTGLGIMAVCSDTLGALASISNGEYTQLQVNADGALYVEVAESASLTVDLGSNNDVTITSGSVGHDITGMVSASNTDISDSTAEVIRPLGNVACKRVDIMAAIANTGVIYVGGSNMSATNSIALNPGDFYSIDVDGTSDVYVLAAVDGEEISFAYFT